MSAFSLTDLVDLIRSRSKGSGDKSYTRQLLDAGAARCAKKFGEEAVELVIAVAEKDASAIRNEAADVLYHLLVVLQVSEVPFQDVVKELDRRTARSGLEEKASRPG